MSGYPIGIRWRAVDKNGDIAEFWLVSRSGKYYERWFWKVVYSDGSLEANDWKIGKRAARDEAAMHLFGKVRFKRVR